MRAKLAKKNRGGAFRAVFCAATAFAALAATATTYYAKPDGDDTKDGLSWENAVTITNGFAKVNGKNTGGLELVLGRGTYKLPAGIGCNGGNTEANRVVVRGVCLSGQATGKYGYCSVSNCVFASNTCNGRGGAPGLDNAHAPLAIRLDARA